MKQIRLMSLSIVLFMVVCTSVFAQVNTGKTGEQIVNSFARDVGIIAQEMGISAEEVGITTDKNAERHLQFMKDILLGEYPELTTIGSRYVSNQSDLDLVLEYVTGQMSPLFEDLPVAEEMKEAIPTSSNVRSENRKLIPYNRAGAISYAYTWYNKRNRQYPDFGDNDCTNFVSQALVAGGFGKRGGAGFGQCRSESDENDWYVNLQDLPPIWCQGEHRDWVWSSSWSTVEPFKQHFTVWRDEGMHAIDYGWTTDPFVASLWLSPGDVVQLQMLYTDDSWRSYHNMLVTKEDSTNGLYMTYHSRDTKDKPLKDIPTGSNQRYVLIKFN